MKIDLNNLSDVSPDDLANAFAKIVTEIAEVRGRECWEKAFSILKEISEVGIDELYGFLEEAIDDEEE